jgi:hypothetical protein
MHIMNSNEPVVQPSGVTTATPVSIRINPIPGQNVVIGQNLILTATAVFYDNGNNPISAGPVTWTVQAVPHPAGGITITPELPTKGFIVAPNIQKTHSVSVRATSVQYPHLTHLLSFLVTAR